MGLRSHIADLRHYPDEILGIISGIDPYADIFRNKAANGTAAKIMLGVAEGIKCRHRRRYSG